MALHNLEELTGRARKVEIFLRNYESKTPHLWMIEPCLFDPLEETKQ